MCPRFLNPDYKIALIDYESDYLKASTEFLRRNVAELEVTNPGCAAAILKRLGGAPGDSQDGGDFILLSHRDHNLSPEESTQKILDFFASISQEYPPLNEELLPDRVKNVLNAQCSNIPVIADWQVFEAIKKTKKPKSGVPGDLPRKIVQEFAAKKVIFRRQT